MRKLVLHIIIVFSFGFSLKAQINLVPNPSFEEKDSCGDGWRAIDLRCKEWFTPMLYLDTAFNPYIPNNYGSSDYFNVCNTIGFQTPDNAAGFQYPHSGVAYAGFALLTVKHPPNYPYQNYKEYIEIQLTQKLVKGRKYCVEFYYSLSGISNYHEIGVEALITDTIVKRTPHPLFWFTDINANAQISEPLPPAPDTVN